MARTTDFHVEDTMTNSIKQPLWLAGAIVLGLVTSAGHAMAQDSSCEGRSILNQTVRNVTVDGVECTIINSVINGTVTATNGAQLQMFKNNVFGEIKLVATGDSFVSGNIVNAASIVVDSVTTEGTEILVSSNNIRGRGDIKFTAVGESLIYENSVADGSIECIDSKTIAEANYASGGVNCPGAGP